MSYFELDSDSNAVKQPRGLRIRLRNHQLTAIAAMLELENNCSIIIDRPDTNTGLYQTVRHIVTDVDEFTMGTYTMETNSAILADKVGAGKSLDIIGLILHRLRPEGHNRFLVGSNYFTIKMIDNNSACNVNLLVVPHNLVWQWQDFISKSRLKYKIMNSNSDFDEFYDISFTTSKGEEPDSGGFYREVSAKIYASRVKANPDLAIKFRARDKIYEYRVQNADRIQTALQDNHVFLLNINRYNSFKSLFTNVRWARVIIDEMDSISIPVRFNEYGNFNWFLTATPTSIFNRGNNRYVSKIFGHSRGLLSYFTVKNKDEFIDECIHLPQAMVFMIDAMMHAVVSAIKDLIPDDVLQLINAGNMQEAITKLNCDVDTSDNIAAVFKHKHQKELHNLERQLDYMQSIIPDDPEAHIENIKKLERNIASCQDRLNMIDSRIASVKEETCLICAEEFQNPTILNCCQSVFCLKCLMDCLKRNRACPYCRQEVKNKEFRVISQKPIRTKKQVKRPKSTAKKFISMDKCDILECLLKFLKANCPNPKILIFSDYAQTFNKIITNIANANLQYALISGTPSHIDNTISEFNNGDTNILLLDSKHYGSGLNLQRANFLILYHRMVKELEEQVVGRAQRDGRDENLRIIYLLHESESHVSPITNHPISLKQESDLAKIIQPHEKQDASGFVENVDADAVSDAEITAQPAPRRPVNSDSEQEAEADPESESEPEAIDRKTKRKKQAIRRAMKKTQTVAPADSPAGSTAVSPAGSPAVSPAGSPAGSPVVAHRWYNPRRHDPRYQTSDNDSDTPPIIRRIAPRPGVRSTCRRPSDSDSDSDASAAKPAKTKAKTRAQKSNSNSDSDDGADVRITAKLFQESDSESNSGTDSPPARKSRSQSKSKSKSKTRHKHT